MHGHSSTLAASPAFLTARLVVMAVARRWRWALLVMLLVALAATAAVYLRRPTYESRAGLVINIERFNVSTSRADARQNLAVLTTAEAVTSQSEAIRSRDLMEEVVRSLDPAVFEGPPPSSPLSRLIADVKARVATFGSDVLRQLSLLPPRNEFYERVQKLERGLDVSTVRQAQVIRLSYQADTAEAAKTILEQIIEVYVRRMASRRLASEEYTALIKEASRFRSELDVAEQELSSLRTRYGIADLNAEKLTVSDRLNRLTASLEGAQVQGAQAQAGPATPARAQSLDPRPGAGEARGAGDIVATTTIASSGTSSGQIAQLRAQLNALVVERASLDTIFAADHPRVVSLDRQIGKIEELLRRETTALTEALDANRARLQELLRIEPQFTRLTRNVSILSDSYEVYRKAATDRQIMGEQEARVQLQVIDPPAYPYQPRGPSRAILVASGLGASLVLGIAFALLASFLEGDLRLARRRGAASAAE